MQFKDFNYPFPNCFTLKNLFHGDALPVCGFHSMQPSDYLFQFLDIGHAAASTKSPTL